MRRLTYGKENYYNQQGVWKRWTICWRRSRQEAEALKIIADIDKRRMTNYRYYTDNKWGMARNYTLTLNSSWLIKGNKKERKTNPDGISGRIQE